METITIPKSFPMFTTYKTMLLAVGKDQTKENIYQTVYFSGEELVCTDGCRLHMVTNKDIIPEQFKPKTCYKVLVNDSKQIIFQENPDARPYPQYDVILQDINPLTLAFDIQVDKRNTAGMSITLCKIYKTTDTMINIEYLKDLHGDEYNLYYDESDNEKPLNFISDDMRIVIMPLSQEDK